MPTSPATTTPLGARVLKMYADGIATRDNLDTAYSKGWISDADYEAATSSPAEPEPEPPVEEPEEPAQAKGAAQAKVTKKKS